MSKTTRDKILSKLARLAEYVSYLKRISKYSKKRFVSDFQIFGLAERYLQLAIEVVLDVSKLLIIDFKLRKPESNQDLFDVLLEAKVISPTLHKRLFGIGGFRNILVHDYEKIDREIVYKNLKQNIGDFGLFHKSVIRKLD